MCGKKENRKKEFMFKTDKWNVKKMKWNKKFVINEDYNKLSSNGMARYILKVIKNIASRMVKLIHDFVHIFLYRLLYVNCSFACSHLIIVCPF